MNCCRYMTHYFSKCGSNVELEGKERHSQSQGFHGPEEVLKIGLIFCYQTF